MSFNIHRFYSRGRAYDMSQCDDSIKDGDILVVLDNDDMPIAVAILVEAWPTSVAPDDAGIFHELGKGISWHTLDGGKYLEAAKKAYRTLLCDDSVEVPF